MKILTSVVVAGSLVGMDFAIRKPVRANNGNEDWLGVVLSPRMLGMVLAPG